MPHLHQKHIGLSTVRFSMMSIILIIVGLAVDMAQAQLSPCGSLQQPQSRCEGPKWTPPTPETIRDFTGEQPRRDNFGGLPDVSQVRPFQRRLQEDPSAALIMPPIDGVRDFLNRRDPEHAIYPLQLPPRPQLSPRNR
jgi:hypothetical protein